MTKGFCTQCYEAREACLRYYDVKLVEEVHHDWYLVHGRGEVLREEREDQWVTVEGAVTLPEHPQVNFRPLTIVKLQPIGRVNEQAWSATQNTWHSLQCVCYESLKKLILTLSFERFRGPCFERVSTIYGPGLSERDWWKRGRVRRGLEY